MDEAQKELRSNKVQPEQMNVNKTVDTRADRTNIAVQRVVKGLLQEFGAA